MTSQVNNSNAQSDASGPGTKKDEIAVSHSAATSKKVKSISSASVRNNFKTNKRPGSSAEISPPEHPPLNSAVGVSNANSSMVMDQIMKSTMKSVLSPDDP